MTTHWTCTCGATGSYAWAAITTKTDASLPDAKHQAKCHGSVTTHTAALQNGRIREVEALEVGRR